MASVHVPAGSDKLSSLPPNSPGLAPCNTFQAGDTMVLGTYPLDVTCPLCYAILTGRAASVSVLFGGV